jgi:hypothetical protein
MSKIYYKSNPPKRPKNAQNGRFGAFLGRFGAFLGVLGRFLGVFGRWMMRSKKCDHYF